MLGPNEHVAKIFIMEKKSQEISMEVGNSVINENKFMNIYWFWFQLHEYLLVLIKDDNCVIKQNESEQANVDF